MVGRESSGVDSCIVGRIVRLNALFEGPCAAESIVRFEFHTSQTAFLHVSVGLRSRPYGQRNEPPFFSPIIANTSNNHFANRAINNLH